MTDGGSDHPNDHAPGRAQVSWPAPPSGDWGASPHAPPPPTPSPTRRNRVPRRDVVGIAVVLVLTGAIVVVAFTALGGKPRPSASAEPKFQKVGNSIDGSSRATTFTQDPAFEPPADPELLESALPTAEDVEAQVEVAGGDTYEETDEPVETGPLFSNCTDQRPVLEGGAVRFWTTRTGEVDVRIDDLGSAAAARASMEARQSDEYITCLPGEIAPKSEYLSRTPLDGDVVDSSVIRQGDQREVKVLIEDGDGDGKLFVWRQVGQYTISARIWVVEPDADTELALTSSDELLDAVESNLPS
jgi:hypothetical protein